MSVERFEAAGPLRGTLVPPPDKSISHRAALIAAMCEGETLIDNYLDSEDTSSSLSAVRALGAVVDDPAQQGDARQIRVGGIGLRGPGELFEAAAPAIALDVGNAGTLLRLLPGWLAGQPRGSWTLNGDSSIQRRPVDRVVDPLRAMGADIACAEGGTPPIEVRGAALAGAEHRLAVASAQVKSCLILAGLVAEGETAIVEPSPTRDHTERMVRAAGADVTAAPATTGVVIRGSLPAKRIVVRPGRELGLERIEVPGDISSAAFVLAAALLVPGSEVRVEGVGLNPTRVGILGVLNRMGAPLEVEEGAAAGGEPAGAITARHGPLQATRVGGDEVPLAIDELPLVALLGCFAEGETVVTDAQELRHKESDRIATVVEGLRGLGAEIEATGDGFAVRGAGSLRGGRLEAHGDHRLAMLGAVAGLASRDGVEVSGAGAAAVSYPGFGRDLTSLQRRATPT